MFREHMGYSPCLAGMVKEIRIFTSTINWAESVTIALGP